MMVTASEVAGHKNQPLLAYTAQPPATMIRKRLASAGHVACAASKEAIDAHYASSSSLSRSSLSLSTPLPSPVPTASSAHHSHTSSQFSVPTDVEFQVRILCLAFCQPNLTLTLNTTAITSNHSLERTPLKYKLTIQVAHRCGVLGSNFVFNIFFKSFIWIF